jgi:endonuclease-3
LPVATRVFTEDTCSGSGNNAETRFHSLPRRSSSRYCEQLEQDIRSTGFFRNKARNIVAAANVIAREFGGKVPHT